MPSFCGEELARVLSCRLLLLPVRGGGRWRGLVTGDFTGVDQKIPDRLIKNTFLKKKKKNTFLAKVETAIGSQALASVMPF